MKKEEVLLRSLSATAPPYLKAGGARCTECFKEVGGADTVRTDFIALYRVDEITFEDKAPRKEALENVISSMNIEGVNFVYIIIGNKKGVSFYYGAARDFSAETNDLAMNDIGDMILKPSLQGNFRGSVISEVGADDKKEILREIENFRRAKILEGVPGINKDDENFQSVDRIIDVMLGDSFAVMLVAKPVSLEKINEIKDDMCRLYDVLSPVAKSSVQKSTGENSSTSETESTGTSETKGTSSSKSKQKGESTSTGHTKGSGKGKTEGSNKSTSTSTSKEKGSSPKTQETIGGSEGSHTDQNTSTNESESTQTSKSNSESDTTGSSESTGKNESKSISTQSGKNTGCATTLEQVNKKVQDWMKYMDDVIFPRLDYGSGKGLFISSMLLLGKEQASLIKLENTIRSVYGGEAGNRMPLKAFDVQGTELSFLKKMQIPKMKYDREPGVEERSVRTVCSQLFADNANVWLGNWMSSRELSLMASIPQKEVVGLALREEVEFGLNIDDKMEDPILLGHLVQSGDILDGKDGSPDIPVHFDKSYFDKHIFITGVTGSGKTTTCQKLLLESKANFLVIEPAKTEYRILATTAFQDMLVFTLGKETGAPFRLNPFEFFEGESITSRVDMIKASMEAAFDMEAAIPQILETAIYECYDDKGWDISSNLNRKFEHPYADGVQSFPTLTDLEKKIEKVVKAQGFEERLKSEYIGSIHARLKGLMVGAKGLMLDTPRSIDFVELLDRKVVLELENIKSASEKSLIMGFILANLSEAIRVKYSEKHEQIEHVTLIEEAHRLLSRYMPGDSMNKKQGVEMFADMLAEVRKYGESLMIVDQIPNKLTPEVLKNTNTKIVHRIFAQDDKEAIGNTMALKDEQKEHLSYLADGRAVLMHPGLSRPVQVQILQTEANDTNRIPPEDEQLRERIIEYYRSIYKRGVLPGLQGLSGQPDKKLVSLYLEKLHAKSAFMKEYYTCVHEHKISRSFVADVVALGRSLGYETLSGMICYLCHSQKSMETYPGIETYVKEFLAEIANDKEDYNVRTYSNYDILFSSLI